MNEEAISALNRLIEVCRDGENGFRRAAEGLLDNQLRSLMKDFSRQREQFALELNEQVARLGGKPEDRKSVTGAVEHGWMNIKSAVAGHNDASILEECERGEDAAKKAYEDALRKNLPADMKAVVQKHYVQVKETHDRIRSLELVMHR